MGRKLLYNIIAAVTRFLAAVIGFLAAVIVFFVYQFESEHPFGLWAGGTRGGPGTLMAPGGTLYGGPRA